MCSRGTNALSIGESSDKQREFIAAFAKSNLPRVAIEIVPFFSNECCAASTKFDFSKKNITELKSNCRVAK